MRADTLDLQDQENPSAAEHTKHPQQSPTGNAPHVAAQVNHVLEERHSEEQALADAWNIAGTVTDDTSVIDQAQSNQAQEHATNGATHEGEEGGAEGAETEAESDDDMMDRISSSPSIDDGQYTSPSFHPTLRNIAWPGRSSSLSPRSTPTPTRASFNQTADITPESSPFLQTPQHFPMRARKMEVERSPLATHLEDVTSPFDHTPKLSLPKRSRLGGIPFFPSKHHQKGRYDSDLDTDFKADDGVGKYRNQYDPTSKQETNANVAHDEKHHTDSETVQDSRRPIESPFRRHSFIRSVLNLSQPSLEPSPSLSSIKSVDMDTLLLPRDDPLLNIPPSPTGSTGSWESTTSFPSDQSDSGDSKEVLLEDSEKDYDDDDVKDVFIDLDERFIDSGWGGECLRETEDIDFEFVYALHTFVATVEGQANATKGDTMVLLDDSNSYWWLVRVVKDSSIGMTLRTQLSTWQY